MTGGRFDNADFRDGYATGFVDCVIETTKREAEQARPSETLEESRSRLVDHCLSALITVGMLSQESAEALLSLWDRCDRLTAVELEAIRSAVDEQADAR